MTQRLEVCSALPEDPILVLNSQGGHPQPPVTLALRNSNALASTGTSTYTHVIKNDKSTSSERKDHVKSLLGWRYNLVVACFPRNLTGLCLIPSTEERKEEERKRRHLPAQPEK